jgi:TonB C terminal
MGVQFAFCTALILTPVLAPVLAFSAEEEDSKNPQSKKVVVAADRGAKSTSKSPGVGHNSALSGYLLYVNEKVKRAWAPSLKASTVVIAFNIDSSGQITEPILEESVGGTLAEDVAKYAIEDSFPFKPLPEGITVLTGVHIKFERTNKTKTMVTYLGPVKALAGHPGPTEIPR